MMEQEGLWELLWHRASYLVLSRNALVGLDVHLLDPKDLSQIQACCSDFRTWWTLFVTWLFVGVC
jgi:hypothetical protein